MLKIHQANSSRKWRLVINYTKMEKLDLRLSTFVQYVEDFKFWVGVAERPHRIHNKEITKWFVSELKPEIFREEMYMFTIFWEFGRCGQLAKVAYLSWYSEISDKVKKFEPKAEFTKEKLDYS